ncbi:MAG: hypothetical protein H6621_04750 [Halobacteriovoraceae bacterium]|nr:hypothetical protein [Halobacteriovoraceae bacterium]
MDWIKEIKKENLRDHILSLEEYMNLTQKHPRRECRSTSLYFRDMFEYYGQEEENGFKLFKKSAPNYPPLQGQEKTQNEIYKNISNFVEEGFNNKFILLVGPNGSSKTSIIKKIMMAAEEYSKMDEGALYTFSWIFPIDNYLKGTVGLNTEIKSKTLDTYAYIDDKDISAILSSDLKDHPLLLIPIEQRKKLIDESFSDSPDILESLQKSYLYNGELSKRNKMIFEALLKNYQGNYLEVYKHIRVERFFIDRQLSSSAVTIEPQLHVDAKLQQITMDRRLASLPPSLQSLNLFSLSGEAVMANRGILEYSDLLKRPIDAFKYLLTTMENKSINLGGVVSELDIFFIGTSNEVHFNAFKQHPDFNSFKGRFNFIKVPYLLDYKKEVKIYEEQIHNLKDRCHFENHSIGALCLWSIMTRIRKPQIQNYPDKKLAALVGRLNPIDKAFLIAHNQAPESFTLKEKQTLLSNKSSILREFENDNMYEGKFGISPREIKQIIYDLTSKNVLVTFIDVLDYLQEFVNRKSEFDFLNIAPQGEYHHTEKFIQSVEEYYLSLFDSELRDCLGLVDERSYEDYISKYVYQVTALIQGEKIKNSVTGKYETSDQFFIKEFENNIQLKDKPDEYRSHIISRLGAYSIDNPGKKLVMTEVFPDIVKSLKESFREEQKKVINSIGKSLVYYLSDDKQPLNQETKRQIDEILDNLMKKYQYTKEGAISVLKYLIKKKY